MKANHLFRRVFTGLLTLVMAIPVLPGRASAALSAEILNRLNNLKTENTAIKAEIAEVSAGYDANATQIRNLVSRKESIDREIALLHTQILNMEEQLVIMGQLAADKQDELENAQQNLDDMNLRFRERIRAMEEGGRISYWEVIFRSKSLSDILDRINIMDEIASADQRTIDKLNEAALEVEIARALMAEEAAELDATRQELTEAQSILRQRRTESDAALRELVQKQQEFAALLEESEAKQAALLKEIASAQTDYNNAEYQEHLKNLALTGENPPSDAKWITPVSDYRISSAFGNRTPPTAGASTYHQGIDMACPSGTPIYATRAGTVTRAAYQADGAGYYVSLNHGDGFGSVYMQMTYYVVSAGQSVSAGQLLGYVGSTGISTGPHLHFGISYAGTYVNPLAYID